MSDDDKTEARRVVRDLAAGVVTFDDREAADQAWILDWVDSGAELFRLQKPVTPPEHLAVYAALLDEDDKSVLLVDHVKARLWLMPGGHVDPDEDPREAVVRELAEELKIGPSFHPQFGDAPFFLTVTQTVPPHPHTDVTFWMVFSLARDTPLVADPEEFSGVRWFRLDEPATWEGQGFDPQMHRFLAKLSSALEPVGVR